MKKQFALILVLLLVPTSSALAQSTAFTYQGRLSNNNTPATGNYDFEFRLFDAASGGTQQGTTVQLTNVAVDKGIFTVQLTFGACPTCFNGADRFLEISVRPAGDPGGFQQLLPRQQVTSTPYAIKSLSADGLSVACVSCVTSSQIGSVNGSAVTGTIPVASVPAGSTNYIQNTASLQPSSNFNISGNGLIGGRLGLGTTAPGFKLEVIDPSNTGLRVQTNTAGGTVASFGGVGAFNVDANGFVGGRFTVLENGKVGIGTGAPASNLHVNVPSSGNPISALSVDVQSFQTTGNAVASHYFRVRDVGSGSAPAFLIRGDGNVGIGTATPLSRLYINSTGTVRATVNSDSNAGFGLGLNNQPKWSVATVTGGHFQIFNDALGSNAVWIDTANNNVGIGTTTATAKLTVDGGNDRGLVVSTTNSGTFVAQFGPIGSFAIDSLTNGAGRFLVDNDSTVWINTPPPGVPDFDTADRLIINGAIRAHFSGGPSTNALCKSVAPGTSTIVLCASSIRYKTNVHDFAPGLNLIHRLRPVSFNWKQGGLLDLGLIAEEVAEIEPLLATYDEKGEIQGVKYDRVSVVLINAVKEQQTQIATQQAQIETQQKQIAERERQAAIQQTQIRQDQKQLAAQQARMVEQGARLEHQQREIDALKHLLCPAHPRAQVCRATRRKP